MLLLGGEVKIVPLSIYCYQMSQLKITTVQSHVKQRKIASHTHIVGLGLTETGEAKPEADGLVGQTEAREV